MNYEKGSVLCSKLSFNAVCEGAAEGELILPDYYPPITKIVKSGVSPYVKSKNFYGDKLVVEGSATFRVTYLSEDGRLCGVFSSVPFSASCRWEGEETMVRTSCRSEYFDVRALSPQKLHFKATVSVGAEAFSPADQPVLLAAQGDGEVELRTSEAVCCRNTAFGQKNINISDEVPVEGRPVPAEILDYSLDFIPGEEKVLEGKAVAKGDMVLTVIYRSEEGSVEVFEHKIALSQVIDASELDEDTLCCVSFSPAEFSLSLKEDENTLLYDGVVSAELTGWKSEKYQVVSDAFSPGYELELKPGRAVMEKALFQNETITFNERISVPAAKIHSVVPKARIEKISVGDNGEGVISGVFVCSVFYEDSEGMFSGCDKELPFTMKAPLDGNVMSLRGDLSMGIASSAFLCTDASSVEVRMNCTVRGILFAAEEKEIVSDITLLGEKQFGNTANAVLYFAREGDCLWDVAKEFSVSPALIMADNGLSEEVFSSDQRILITRG